MRSTTSSRIISGSLASWSQIIINLTAQLLFTPIYLSYWTSDQYGIWLTFLAATGFLQIIDTGHQTYLGNKFLILGPSKIYEISQNLSSAIPIATILSVIQIALTFIIVNTLWFEELIDKTGANTEFNSLQILLVTQACTWGLTGSLGGLFTRALNPFGYFSRFSWWQTLLQTSMFILPMLSVILGYGLLVTGMAMLTGILLLNILVLMDVKRLLEYEKVKFVRPKIVQGFTNLKYSLILTTKAILEMFRQQGARLILSPLAGASEMVAFSTMRTGANVTMQGLNSITNPMMPEVMRFLNQKDQNKLETAFGTIWIILIALLAPTIVLLQGFVEPLFIAWTRGQIAFDSQLFGVLSMSILFFAICQPAIGVVNGNNLLRPQLILSVITALIAVFGMFILIPSNGIRGAGISLLSAEIVSSVGYCLFANNWLTKNGLRWPKKLAIIALISILLSASNMVLLAKFSEMKFYIIVTIIFFMTINLIWFVKNLPELAIERLYSLIRNFSILKKMYNYFK